MKNITKPENMIGFTKVVDGFNFTLVEKEKMTYMVEITKDNSDFTQLETVAHNTWKAGKFTKLLRQLNPQPKKEKVKKEPKPRGMKPKFINGKWFYPVKKFIDEKGRKRVEVVAEGNENDVYVMALGTWYSSKFYNNFMKFLNNIVRYLPALITEKPISADIVQRHIHELETTLHYKEFKKLYNTLVKLYHPDCGGCVAGFEKIQQVYKFQAPILKKFEPFIMSKEGGRNNYDRAMSLVIGKEYWSQNPADIDKYPRTNHTFMF